MMLSEMITELDAALEAGDDKKVESTYRLLEKVGMDRMTTDILLREFRHDRHVFEPREDENGGNS